MTRFCALSLLMCLTALCVGCGQPDYYNFSGTVTKDGTPIPHLQITLMPDAIDSTRPPMCLSKEDGSFVMRTGRETGAPPGSYTIHIEDPVEADGGRTPKQSDPYYEDYMYVIERYSPDNSDLKVELDSHQNSYELKLDTREYTKEKVPLKKTRNTTDEPV